MHNSLRRRNSMTGYDTMIFGASYGSLLATNLPMAGHNVSLVGLPGGGEIINGGGTRVPMPVRGSAKQIEISSIGLPGRISAATTSDVDPSDFDLVGLAMQEPQYRAPGVRELLDATA